jgi:hypothetical protein
MSENGKSPDQTGIWDNANQAREIHLALMFALATTAFADGWQALRPSIAAGKQGQPGPESDEAAERKEADAA